MQILIVSADQEGASAHGMHITESPCGPEASYKKKLRAMAPRIPLMEITPDEEAPLNTGEEEAEAEDPAPEPEPEPELEPEPEDVPVAVGLAQGVEVLVGLVLVWRADEGGGVTLDRWETVRVLAVVVC